MDNLTTNELWDLYQALGAAQGVLNQNLAYYPAGSTSHITTMARINRNQALAEKVLAAYLVTNELATA